MDKKTRDAIEAGFKKSPLAEKEERKKIRTQMLEEKRKELLKHKKKMKEGYEVRDVEGKVIPRRGPHSTFEGRLAERRRGYLRKTKKFEEAASAESKKKDRRTHLGTIRKIYANEHPRNK